MNRLRLVLAVFLSLILLLLVAYAVVIQYAPSFGGDLTAQQKKEFEHLQNFDQGKFRNAKDVPKPLTFKETLKLGYAFFTTKVENARPRKALPLQPVSAAELTNNTETRLIWFGHSSFLLQHSGKNILLDPMFGEVPAPFPWLGEKRFSDELPIAVEDLPPIDVVVISHDHYDHLDYTSIQKLLPKVKQFVVPLGIDRHLLRWGVPLEKITTRNWWESLHTQGFDFICTPAQHFSGRKFSNSQETLWASWVIKSDSLALYFSGDSGYEKHFAKIGEKYGPFDVALVECGQYNTRWADIHMFPEETVRAGKDLRAKKIIPIHWGAFKLAMHPWNEPVIRAVNAAKKENMKIEVPVIGESIVLDTLTKPLNVWW